MQFARLSWTTLNPMAQIYTLNQYYRERFGTKVYKLSLDGGMTCPNRDGTLDTRGCIFCSAGGSGDFAASRFLSISEQIADAKNRVKNKIKSGKYIAYFQAFTNTYAPVEYLRNIFTEAINNEEIIGLSIATRPDCLSDDIISLLSELNQQKPVFIELGLQTIHESTAAFIRRGYPLSCFDDAVNRLAKENLNIIVHIILGLPGENFEDMVASVRYLNQLPINGIKLQLLHVLKHTDLADYYLDKLNHFETLTLEDYTVLLGECIENLRPDIVIHRMAGDGKKSELIAPLWSADKKKVLNTINHYFEEHNIIQGRKYDNYGS